MVTDVDAAGRVSLFLRLDADCKLGPITASSIQSTSRQLKSCNCHGCTLQICVSAQSDSFSSAHLGSRYPLFRLLSLSRAQLRCAPFAGDGTFTCGFYNISTNASTFSIWFSKVPERTVVWSANPLRPVYSWGSTVKLNFDGSMVLRDYGGQIVWTNTVSSSNAEQAQLLDTGNLIVKGKGDTILWQSFTSPTDTLLPGQRINAAIQIVSTNRLLVPGHYSLHFDDQVLISLFDDQKDLSFIYWPDPTLTIWQKLRIPFMSNTSGVLDSLAVPWK